jgi:hypothetical protein
MTAIIPILLSMLEEIAPGATTVVIEKVVNLLVVLVPIIIQEYKDLVPIVTNIIAALQQSGDITPDQWAALDAMSKQYDADFHTALTAAMAQDAVATKPAA